MQFHIKQLDASMGLVDSVIDAANETEARELVANAGGHLVDIRAVRGIASTMRGGRDFNLSVFNQQMHSLLEAGQTVVDAIEILGRNERKDASRAVYDALLRSLRSGHQLSYAMEGLPSVFPPLYVSMVRSSETTGTVRASIRRYQLYQQQVDALRGTLRAAATYPAILLGVGFLVISFLMLYVLPRFSAVYEDAGSLRGGATFVQWWGRIVRDHQALAWSGFAALIGMLVFAAVHPAVRTAAFRRLLASPWIGDRIRVLQLGRLYRTLAMLLLSGLSMLAAMRLTRASLPLAMHAQLDDAARRISEGMPMSDALRDCALGTEVAIRLLVAGQSSGNLAQMMNHIADFYDQETAMWVDAAGRLIEPVLMLAIGLVVGAIVLMLYSPIFDLAEIV